MALVITKAVRKQSKASILIEGLQGSGKSGLALEFAFAFAGGNPDQVGAIDTENKSIDLFEGLPLSSGSTCGSFNKIDLTSETGFAPTTYLEARLALAQAGCTVVINDSISHSWTEENGVLQQVSKLTADNAKINNFNAWNDVNIANEKNNIKNLIRDPDVHVISTVRVKEKFKMDDTGVHSVGEQEIQQDTLKYEPDLVLRMVEAGSSESPAQAMVLKSRYAMLRKGVTYAFTKELIAQVVEYLSEGADPKELEARQMVDLQTACTDILKNSSTAKTKYNMLKRQLGLAADAKLTDMTLAQLQHIYTVLSNISM